MLAANTLVSKIVSLVRLFHYIIIQGSSNISITINLTYWITTRSTQVPCCFKNFQKRSLLVPIIVWHFSPCPKIAIINYRRIHVQSHTLSLKNFVAHIPPQTSYRPASSTLVWTHRSSGQKPTSGRKIEIFMTALCSHYIRQDKQFQDILSIYACNLYIVYV